MDEQTIAAYNTSAAERCERYRLILPNELRRFVPAGFHKGQPTADIGCGSGSDVAWLDGQGFPTTGYDAAEAMLAEARAAFPTITVYHESLPNLGSIASASYMNALCNATLMHVPAEQQPAAVAALARILLPGGRLLLSVRSGRAGALREPDGRLFTPISDEQLTAMFQAAGLATLEQHDDADSYRPGILWHTVLAEKVTDV